MTQRTLREQLAPINMRARLLPRGFNSAREASQIAPKATSVQQGETFSKVTAQPCKPTSKRKLTPLQQELIKYSRYAQSMVRQSDQVEIHMALTKPVNHRYPEPIPAPDRADKWKRKRFVAHNPRVVRDAKLREKLAKLEAKGMFDDQI